MFQRALSISSRYQPAMWGLAETYQSMGENAKAIEAYQNFSREHPDGRQAEMARRQIERLGGTP
jgi:regulator of sirC expression with transglutaminase-like and TPR domain